MNDRHPGDTALDAVLRALPRLYSPVKSRTEERLRAYLQPKLKALQPRTGESKADYKMRLISAFSGPRWLLLRRKIALDYTDAYGDTLESINTGLIAAFVDGLNESAYTIALSGGQAWPITISIATHLEKAGAISLNRRKLKKGKDTQYNEQRLQSTLHSVVLQGAKPEEIPEKVAQGMTNARKNEGISVARATVYGASDSGAYIAGLEAESYGMDIEKTWLAIMDMRVRTSHKHLHGTTIPLHEEFRGYYGKLRYPHDPDAPPQETYRCRCRMAVHLAGKSPGEYSRSLLPSQTAAYRRWRDMQIQKAGGEIELYKLHLRRIRK